ncbi:hypothetical protein BDW42DRAFT_185810 [Aspergillus taichungensis]|uniref:Peptide hydrolase n=1 Tax=Aspergillus taichungensis TaxID=482145 RepID=A0A2J5HTV9_9EURO|nr:hypothetical protein BDW42DRAFT_185810 [Aspergillus taichungensis]
MARSRQPARFSSEAPSESSSATSPDRTVDDDTDFFTAQANDSQSSIGVANSRDIHLHDDVDMMVPPIARLPPEILIAIFAKLSATADMLSCMLVCRGWAANCVGILWHRPSCNSWKNMASITASVGKTNGSFSYAELIRRLNLSALTDDVSDGTVVPFAQCNRIERLTLTNCSKLTDKGVSELVEGNRHLQALDVSDLRFLTDHTLFTVAKNCPRLQGLNITGCVNASDDSLVTVSENCRQIKRLKLNGLTQVTNRAIMSFAQHCPAILEIDLHDCKLVKNPSVTALMATLQNLRELRLAHCTEIDDTAFLDLPKHLSMDSLRILDLTACENIRDDAVERIVQAAPRLRNLVLAKCRLITDRAVWAICKLGKNLHYVHLGHCSNITDTAVMQLVKSCNRIRYIDLACCNSLTDRSVQQLATLPKLRRIGLVKCQLITDQSILALARPKVPHQTGVSSLERVHLSYCVHLTMPGIHALLNHCPRLTHLSLTGVGAFLRPELTVFCREAPPEFTHQQREVFCVFSGDGVNRLRDFLNGVMEPPRDLTEATMYDDDEELDEEEGQVTGLMHATAINDDDYIDVGHTHELYTHGVSCLLCPVLTVHMAPHRSSRANPLAFTPWPVTLITTLVYLALLIPVLVIHNVVPPPPRPSPKGLDIAEAWADLQYLTNGFHPYNSHRNDEVRDYLLQRIREIIDDTPSSDVYRLAGDEKPAVFVFDDLRSNLTFADGAAGTGVYFEGTNIIVYVRGTEDDREHWWEDKNKTDAPSRGGVLVNAHYDSVSTGFGATDDGVGVVTCLQLLRYFTTPGHAPRRGLVVLLNNGEEDYLNGARVFSQHPISRLPRTFLNLEGAGAGTRAMLFRTTDEEVTRHYRRAPHPFGSVLSANGFDMRLIRSQTDYVVFNGDMGMRGLDVAFLEPRSRYHTDQDDARHTSKGSLWHMLSAAVGTTRGLVSDPSEQFDRPVQVGAGAPGSKGVWFDLFGSAFVVFRLHTLFALSVTLLVVAPLVLLATSVALTRADKMYLFRSEARSPDRLEGVPLQGLRGFFRFPFLLAIPTAVTVGLAYLVTKVNPYVINSSEYAVWSMMVAAWIFLAWFVSRVADFARPSAFHRVYTLTWMFAVYWVLLVVMTVYVNRDGLAGGYFIFFAFAGVFVATWIGYLEMFALPRRSDYARLVHPPSRHTSNYGSRLSTAVAGDEPENEHDDSDEEHVVEEEPTESTSLLGSGPRTTFANYVRVGHSYTGSHGDEAEAGDPRVYKHEQPWSANLLQWSWVVQFLLVAPITLIMVGPLSLLLTSALHQTGPDGSSSLFIYVALAGLTTFLLTPLLPFVHRLTHHIPVFLLAVFTATLIYNLVAFPFSDSSRLKLFFVQELDLDTGSNRASLTGVAPFVHLAASGLPSVHSTQNLTCDPVANRLQCSWPGPAPNVVDATTSMQDWVRFNITQDKTSKSTSNSKSKSAHITLTGQNTRSCRLLFTQPISSFNVRDSATDPARFPDGAGDGGSRTKEIRLWSRTWNATWEVDVALEGRALCIWSDGNKEGVIPALDEVRRFVPSWVAVSKLRDGLVEGGRWFNLS